MCHHQQVTVHEVSAVRLLAGLVRASKQWGGLVHMGQGVAKSCAGCCQPGGLLSLGGQTQYLNT